MGKKSMVQRRLVTAEHTHTPYTTQPCHEGTLEKEAERGNKCSKSSEMEDWHEATCLICLEHPHNAILLICSSHNKGSSPYTCALIGTTGACSKLEELVCPQCRSQVKRWTAVEPARRFLNTKRRSCMQDGCAFVGTYKELRQHTRAVHPSVAQWEVDPMHEQKWRRMVNKIERDDVLSIIRSSRPRSVILGDYVLEHLMER